MLQKVKNKFTNDIYKHATILLKFITGAIGVIFCRFLKYHFIEEFKKNDTKNTALSKNSIKHTKQGNC